MYQAGDIKESELIAKFKQGSEEAFSALYAMYARRLYAFWNVKPEQVKVKAKTLTISPCGLVIIKYTPDR